MVVHGPFNHAGSTSEILKAIRFSNTGPTAIVLLYALEIAAELVHMVVAYKDRLDFIHLHQRGEEVRIDSWRADPFILLSVVRDVRGVGVFRQ